MTTWAIKSITPDFLILQPKDFSMSLQNDVAKLVDGMSPEIRAEIFAELLVKKADAAKVGRKVLTPSMSAAADRRHPVLIRQVRTDLARWGYNLRDDAVVDPIQLSNELRAAGCPTEIRMDVKAKLSILGCL
jgi:hypothetical protein